VIRASASLLAMLVLVPAAAGTSTARPSIALTATPSRVNLVGSGQTAVRLRNTGTRSVVLDVARAALSLDLRGRPRIVPGGGAPSARGWLTVRPSRIGLAPGASASIIVAARVPRRVEPGDHDALVLLTTRPRDAGGVAVRMRVGVVVVVRAPGAVVRRLDLRELVVRRRGRTRLLELLVVNRGNVTEIVQRSLVTLTLRRGGRVVAAPRPDPRRLRPRTRGIVQFRYRGDVRGLVTAQATVSVGPAAVTTSYKIRL
jgi:hypothetical protein